VRSLRCLTAAVALLAVLTLSACGGGTTGTGPSTEPTASAPEATTPPTDATQPGTTAVTPPPTTTTQPRTGPAEGTGGASGGGGDAAAGGAQRVRVPAMFAVIPGGRIMPPTITVPPFLAVELSVVANDGKPHRLLLRTTPPHMLRVAAGARAVVRLRGLRAGRYAVLLDGRRAGALVAGGEVGP
jgi:hypothetical protein